MVTVLNGTPKLKKQNADDKPGLLRGELNGSNSCTAEGLTTTGGSPVLGLCRELVAAGFDPSFVLDVYRGATLALRVRSIGDAARLRVAAHGVGFERLHECTGAPLVRQNGSDLSAGWVDWPSCEGRA